MKKLNLALCDSRHEMPSCVVGSIFPNTVSMTDVIGDHGLETAIDTIYDHAKKAGMIITDGETVYYNRFTGEEIHYPSKLDARVCVYVTGFTPCIGAVVNACIAVGWRLTLMHYDRESGEYLPQKIW